MSVLFHLDALALQQSAQMERQEQRERRDFCLYCTTQCHSYTSACQASHYPYEPVCVHTHTHVIVPLTFCTVAAAVGQVVVSSKYMSTSSQVMLSHSSSIRHLSQKATNLLQRICYPEDDFANYHAL